MTFSSAPGWGAQVLHLGAASRCFAWGHDLGLISHIPTPWVNGSASVLHWDSRDLAQSALVGLSRTTAEEMKTSMERTGQERGHLSIYSSPGRIPDFWGTGTPRNSLLGVGVSLVITAHSFLSKLP